MRDKCFHDLSFTASLDLCAVAVARACPISEGATQRERQWSSNIRLLWIASQVCPKWKDKRRGACSGESWEGVGAQSIAGPVFLARWLLYGSDLDDGAGVTQDGPIQTDKIQNTQSRTLFLFLRLGAYTSETVFKLYSISKAHRQSRSCCHSGLHCNRRASTLRGVF